jgi:hypothetical protein
VFTKQSWHCQEEQHAMVFLHDTTYFPSWKHCTFRAVWEEVLAVPFVCFENYITIMVFQRHFQNYSILLKLLRLGKDRDSCYIFMSVLCFYMLMIYLEPSLKMLHYCDKVTRLVQLYFPEAEEFWLFRPMSI